jgi:aspartate aminotransferase/aminotransferase
MSRRATPPQIFNPAAEEIPQAMSIRFNQIVYERKRRGEDVIVLSLGEAFFEIPLFDFHALDYRRGYHYSDSQGIPELRERIARYYTTHYGVDVDPDTELLISAGSKPLLFMSILAILQPGEEVLLHEPCWLSYTEQIRLCGGRWRFIPMDVPTVEFERYLTPRTRIVILNNPNNPAGRVYDQADLRRLYERCRERGIYLLVDEAYSDFVLDGSFRSVAGFDRHKEFIVVVNSLSKNMGMSGWRIGYVIAHPDFIRVLLKINQHLITCGPTILLMYCATYFDQILAHTLPQVRAVVEKRARVGAMISEMGMHALPGASTFYFFLNLGDYPGTSIDFGTELLQEHGVSVVPGIAYGASVDRYVRVGVGTESEERIRVGLERMKEVIARTRPSGVVFTTEQALEGPPMVVTPDGADQSQAARSASTPARKGRA